MVWPHSFQNELAKMTILNCKINWESKQIDELRTGNLVGFIGNDKVQLEINSRFSTEREEKKEDKRVDFFLYYMLSKVFNVNIVDMQVGSGSIKELNLLFFMFPRLLKEAMSQGVFKQYVKREYNNCNIRGTIDISKHIRKNYPSNGRIAYTTREFSYDNNITQLIRHTIEYISSMPDGRSLLKGDEDLEMCTRIIKEVTPTYQKKARERVINDNNRPTTHPYFTKYKVLQNLCLAILRKEKMSHGSMNNKIHGLLIDVAWLWEEYIGITMREAGFAHHTSDNAFKLFERTDEEQFQNIIPDYVWEQEGKSVIADAKYIPLDEYHHINADKASAVYYKTIMYMYRFATNIGILFHPCKPKENADMQVTFNDYQVANGRNCHLYKVGLVIPDCKKYNEYKDFKEELEKREISFNDTVKRHCFTHLK